MGATYTRQSSYSDGDTITAAHTNDEFNQLLAAFQASTGHTHDGTDNEGGPITKMLGTSLTLGDGTAGTDITVTFDGETSDGVLKWMEDEDYFEFSDDILVASTEKLQFRDTAIYINSSTDGQLDLVADTEIQIAATTIDMNGALDLSGNLTVGGSFTLGGVALTSRATELNLLDGVSGLVQADFTKLAGVDSTATELNIVDGNTSAGTTAVAGGDGIVTNDGGTMRQTTVDTFDTYFAQTTKTLTNKTLTTPVIAEIDNSSDITLDAGGDIILDADGANIIFKDSGTSILDIANNSSDVELTVSTADKNFLIKGTDGSSAITALDIDMALNGKATFSGDVVVTGDLTVTGDDLTMGTNTSGHLLIADGTNFNPTAVGDLSEISTVANDDVFLAVDTSGGGLKKITRSTMVSGLAVGGVALSNIVEDTTPQLGGDLDMNGQDIVTTSNADLELAPNGTGHVTVKGNTNQGTIQLNCENNSHGQQIKAAPHSESANNVLTLPSTGGDARLVSTASTATLTNKTFGDNVSFGDFNITNVGDIAVDSISADGTDINVAVSDNSATAFTIKQGSDNYLVIDTANSSESVAIGTGISGTAITLGHSTSEVTVSDNLTVTGDLTVNGATTTVDTTNTTVKDNLLGLNQGASSNSNDVGIIIERGSTGNDALFMWDESADKFALGTTTDNASSTGNLNMTTGTLVANIEGNVTGDLTGTASTATVATTVTISDNESTNEDNAIIFTSGGDVDGGNIGLESDGDLTYNPSTGRLTATQLSGTLQTAAQANVTSLGTLTTLTVDNVIVNGTTIGHTDDTDLITLADGVATVAGEVSMTTLDIGGTNVTSTAAELNIMDGGTAASSTTLVDADRVVTNDNGTMKQVALTDVKTYLSSAGFSTEDPTALAIALG
jgi:hypothetical protein